jgi:hypothetical protein
MTRPPRWPGRSFVAMALVLVTLMLPACGKGRKTVYPVRGRILVDGKPAPDAVVKFHPTFEDPDRVMPFGQAGAEGNFVISSYVNGDGAPVGEYILTFEWRERSGLLKDNFEGPDRLKGRYYDPKKSTFRVTVDKKPQELPPFELTSK